MNMMSKADAEAQTEPTARDWARIVAAYGRPFNGRASIEMAITFGPFIALWALAAFVISSGYWSGILLTIPAAGFLLRIFIIQHDCGHGAFFSSKAANNWVGRISGVLTCTPYAFWNHAHKMHHMGAGSLTRRGIGDIKTLTVDEFRKSSFLSKLKYRIYRNPLILFVIGPAYIFLIDQRLPLGQMRDGWKPWISTMGTNIMIVLVSAAMMWLVGWKLFLAIQLPITVMAATGGVWLFYVQHQFEETIWEDDKDWTFHEAALYGSSHYDLPQPLQWISGNIGLHHVHHLSSRIPFYRLPTVLRDHPELYEINRMSIWESFKTVPLALWDENKRVLVPIKAA